MGRDGSELGGLNLGTAATGDQIMDAGISDRSTPGGPKSPLVRVAGRFDPHQTVELVLASYKQVEDEMQYLRPVWDQLYAHYRMDVPRPNRKPWQSDVYLAEIAPAVKKFASMMLGILIKSDSYFTLEQPGLPLKAIKGLEAIIRYHHEQPVKLNDRGEFQARGGIFNLFSEAFESVGCFGRAVVKMAWAPHTIKGTEFDPGEPVTNARSGGTQYFNPGFDLTRTRSSRLWYRCVDPRRFWDDESGIFAIEERDITAPELWPFVESGLFDGDQVKRAILGETRSDDFAEWQASKGIGDSTNPFHRNVHLLEYWGPILDVLGREIAKNQRLVVANKQWLLNPQATANPFWHQERPYIVTDPVRCLFRNKGMSPVLGFLSIQKAINQIANMSLDGLKLRLLKPLWVDISRVKNAGDLRNMKPLQLIQANMKGAAAAQVPIGEVPLSDVPGGALAETELLRRAGQNSTMLGDVNLGMSSKRETTATEESFKNRETHAYHETVGRCLEEQLVEPVVEHTKWNALQYWDEFQDPALAQIAKDHGLNFSASSREERVAFLAQPVQVQSRGISRFFERAAESDRLVKAFDIVFRSPEMMARVKKLPTLQRIYDGLNIINSDKLLIDEEQDQLLSQLEFQRILQMLGGGGGGMGGGQVPPELMQALAQKGIDPNSPEGQQIIQETMKVMQERGAAGGA